MLKFFENLHFFLDQFLGPTKTRHKVSTIFFFLPVGPNPVPGMCCELRHGVMLLSLIFTTLE